MSDIQKSLAFLASLEFFGIKLGLHQTQALFDAAGNPQKGLKFIHVAGSNGKGSVCSMLETALRNCGFKTGFYSSPHLLRVGERFRINGISVEDNVVAEYVEKARPAIEELQKKGMRATYFEVTTLIAAMIFADEKVDFVIWETGMGGRLDCTNIVTPVVSVITGISMEHTEHLGDSIEKIAAEKAGIIKPSVPVFCSNAAPDIAIQVIRQKAEMEQAPFALSPAADPAFKPVLEWSENGDGILQTFRLQNGNEIKIPLAGPHQRANASLVYAVLEYLSRTESFDLSRALTGICNSRWEARFQILPTHHLIIDGAHNPEGVLALSETLREVLPDQKFHFIFGAFADKDTFDSLKILAPLAASFQFVQMDTMRSTKTTAELGAELRCIAPLIPSESSYLASTLFTAWQDPHWKVLCGSLHLCGDALRVLQEKVC